MGKPRPVRYMGVDIERGSPQSRSAKAQYHVVIIDEHGHTVDRFSRVTLARLIRIAWYYKPTKIAFDNILELAQNRKALERILELFPPESELVQVTITDKGLTSLRELAAPYRDLVGPGKLRPGKTAYILALLASKGYGVPVRVVESKTKIVVTKARSPSGGGFSQQRYKRRVRASVLNAAMRVKEALDKAGLEYDMNYKRSEGGLESAVFIVYTPRDKLKGIVRPHKGVDYIISIKPEYRTRLSIPAEEPKKSIPVIIGLDPGITTGLAIIDLQGRVLYLDSSKDLDRGRIAEIVMKHGRPIIIAVDVPSPPETARKLAAMLGAMIYTPPEEISIAEKRYIVDRFLGRQPQDSHQRDALAAAIKAYQLLKSKIGHIESQIEKLGIDVDVSRVKEAVIRGLTVAEALEEAIAEKLEEINGIQPLGQDTEKQTRREIIDTSLIASLEHEIEALRRTLRSLREENERLRIKAKQAVARARSEAYRDSLVRKLEAELANMQEEADRLRSRIASYTEKLRLLESIVVAVWNNRMSVAALLPSLTERNLRRAIEVFGSLTGEIIALESPVFDNYSLRLVADINPLGIAVLQGDYTLLAKRLRRSLIPVLKPSVDDIVYKTGNFVVLRSGFVKSLRGAREELEREFYTARNLERMIQEYRRLRKTFSM